MQGAIIKLPSPSSGIQIDQKVSEDYYIVYIFKTPSYLSTYNWYKTYFKDLILPCSIQCFKKMNDWYIFWASIESAMLQGPSHPPNCCCRKLGDSLGDTSDIRRIHMDHRQVDRGRLAIVKPELYCRYSKYYKNSGFCY